MPALIGSVALHKDFPTMQWIIDNWLLLLFGGGIIVMHLFGHGGHGKTGPGGED